MDASYKPIDSLSELYEWVPGDTVASSCQPLINYKHDKFKNGESEVMLCHDMKGGYLDEERDSGCAVDHNKNPYVFLNWWNIDIFCYFSHHFVTIPPRGYVDAAHKNGCLVMGTFITEWTDGKAICEQFLSSEESVHSTVDQLVLLAKHHGFEGWLINIENAIEESFLPNLLLFVRLLTDRMRQHVTYSRVIWYDSVTKDGKLKWQNELNEMNRCFYDACDGIYLNYNWTDRHLLDSADFGLLNRIFVGIDCFARGCVGGWDCHRSFARAKLFRMSVALFAPGWIVETFPKQDPVINGLKFWHKLAASLSTRRISTLPFETTFSTGFEDSGKWFRLHNIGLQPQYNNPQSMRPTHCGLHLEKKGIYEILQLDAIGTGRFEISFSSGFGIVLIDREEICATDQTEGDNIVNGTFDGDQQQRSLCIQTLSDDVIINYVKITNK